MRKNNRTSNTIYNTSSNLIIMLLKCFFTFVSRTFFIKYLGETYLGINELLINIIYMLSVAELGISTAIGYSLYKPISEKDNDKISRIMTFFKRIYKIIGCLVFLLGTILFFFLPTLISEYDSIKNIEIYYFLYLLNTVSTYFLSYKDILIIADQKNYILTKINMFSQFISFILELISIIFFKSFMMYLLCKIIVLIIQRIITNRFISNKYMEIDFNYSEKLEKKDIISIKNNIKGLVFHKIGDYAVNGTDNIIISIFLNVIVVGLYSNYVLLIKFVQNILATFYNSIIPSYGNLVAEGNIQKKIDVFKKIDFLGFFLYSFTGIVFLNCSSSFVELWLGDKYVLPQLTVALISFSFFLTGIRMASFSVKSAAGIFKEDSWGPFLQAFINLFVSIIMCKICGLNGVIIGTIISSFVPIIARIHYIYKIVFKVSARNYYINNLFKYILFYFLVAISSYLVVNIYEFNALISLVYSFIITIIIYICFVLVFFRKYPEYNSAKELINKFIRKVVIKWKKA